MRRVRRAAQDEEFRRVCHVLAGEGDLARTHARFDQFDRHQSLERFELLDEKYASDLARLGATDEGKPGPRGDGFYAAYFRDLDGNKLNFFCFG